jgi:hypothetical protein
MSKKKVTFNELEIIDYEKKTHIRKQEKYLEKKVHQLYRHKNVSDDDITECNAELTYSQELPIAKAWMQAQKKFQSEYSNKKLELERKAREEYMRHMQCGQNMH